uniref:Ferritin n=1 Tax=Xiphophorus couchianus TaxID=32473 RepID=A0A3B5MTI4_9TELE
MTSQIRQNFHQDCEAAINRQINLELYASYVYLSMAYYFDRDDKSLENFAKFFNAQSKEEREHAEKLMGLQNKRGGRIFLQDIKKPDRDEWGSGLEALECALQLEKSVNQSLLDLQKMAAEHNDPHMCDFVETHFLDEQLVFSSVLLPFSSLFIPPSTRTPSRSPSVNEIPESLAELC